MAGDIAGGEGATPATTRRFDLERESELRVEVGPDSPLRVRLLSGIAEIFGAELPLDNWLSIPPLHKIAIFAWGDATVELDGESDVEYVADETPMVSYVNVNAILDGRRIRAKASDSLQGPRVIVVGPTDSGKSSLCRMLLNWACKRNWKPTFVDLDVGQGSITLPGNIAATPVEMLIDSAGGIPLGKPIVYFYGHTSPSTNVELYRVLVKELSQTIERQFSSDSESQAAGMVINTMGWIEGVGYELLLHAIDAFSANVVLVLGQEKLCSMLKGFLKAKPNVDIVKLHKSGGVVPRNARMRQKARSPIMRDYFYGLEKDVSSLRHTINFSDISIFRIGGGPPAPRSALPIGAEPVADPTRLVAVSINRDLLHSVLAVSFAEESDEILSSCIAGFVHVIDVDIYSKTITFILPCPGTLPGKFLIMGTLILSES